MEKLPEKGGPLGGYEGRARLPRSESRTPRPVFDLGALSADRFSWGASLALGLASKLAYESPRVVESVSLGGWGLETVDVFDEGETQGFYAEAGSIGLLSFRGSESLGDWIANMRLRRRRSPIGKGLVHEGFLDAYLGIQSRVVAAADTRASSVKRLWVTGHSLGGALAALACLDLLERKHAARPVLMTFGQPSIGNGRLLRGLSEGFRDRYFRFVNDDDVVTRIPPLWPHAGHVVRFSPHGDPLGSVGSASEDDHDAEKVETLTPSEFAEIQAEIREIVTEVGSDSSSESQMRLDASVEGVIPGIRDHAMDRYIAAIRLQLPRIDDPHLPSSDLGPIRLGGAMRSRLPDMGEGEHPGLLLRGAPLEESELVEGRFVELPDPPVPVLLRLADRDWIPPSEVTLGARFGNIVSARIPRRLIPIIAKDAAVVGIEVSRAGGAPEESLEDLEQPGAPAVRPKVEETGDLALVGIIDTGIDVLHRSFDDDHGQTRILAVWDQREAGGPTPESVGLGGNYGTIYSAEEIEAFKANPETTPSSLRDPNGHGTHVAAIAAGRATGRCGAGMAPGARILVAIPNMSVVPGEPPSIGYSVGHTDALDFLLGVARGQTSLSAERRPIAINVSQGMNAGAHDGMSLLERAFDSATNKGSLPGAVIVKSAGNERGHGGHTRIRAMTGGQVLAQWRSEGFRFEDYIEVWYDSVDDLEFVLRDPSGHVTPPISREADSWQGDLGGNSCSMELRELHPDNGDNLLALRIQMAHQPIQNGEWTLEVVGRNVGSREGFVDLWVERDQGRSIRFSPEDPRITLSIPGTADTVVTVGACTPGDPVALARSSSYGWTRKGGAKPDLCAPGVGILSAQSGGTNHDEISTRSGTSMAAPQVTGALALVFSAVEKRPDIRQHNAQQLQKALRRTARGRSRTHHEGFGWGVLDAQALYDALT